MSYNGPLPEVIQAGGTGAATLTGVLIGHGTSAVTGSTVTQYGMVVAGASNAVSSIAPSATSGVPLVSAGSSANPHYSTALVPGGGTGVATMTTAYAPVCAGTTATGNLQVASTGLSTSGFVLTSTGAASLPSFQAIPANVSAIAGTAQEISASASTGSVTLSIPSLFVAPGSIASTTFVEAGTIYDTATVTSSTAGYYAIDGVSVLHNYGTNNIFVGGAGSFTLTGTNSCMVGHGAGATQTSGSRWTMMGSGAIGSALAGTETDVIMIGYGVAGVNATSNFMRLGMATGTGTGQINETHIAGIFGITTAGSGVAVYVDAADRLGTVVSSERFKENIQNMNDYSSKIMSLRPVTFNYKADADKTPNVGLIAEDVAGVMPDMVVYDKLGLPLTVKYQDLAPMLLNELQKAVKKISDLTTRISKLESK